MKLSASGAYSRLNFWLIVVKHAFVQIVGLYVFVYTAVVCRSMMGDTVRNMPPLAFGIPVNNTVKIGLY